MNEHSWKLLWWTVGLLCLFLAIVWFVYDPHAEPLIVLVASFGAFRDVLVKSSARSRAPYFILGLALLTAVSILGMKWQSVTSGLDATITAVIPPRPVITSEPTPAPSIVTPTSAPQQPPVIAPASGLPSISEIIASVIMMSIMGFFVVKLFIPIFWEPRRFDREPLIIHSLDKEPKESFGSGTLMLMFILFTLLVATLQR